MGKYHNQEYISKVAREIKKKSESEKEEIIKTLKEYHADALYEYCKINPYTAPEEIERREQAVYYYEDLLQKLEEDNEE